MEESGRGLNFKRYPGIFL